MRMAGDAKKEMTVGTWSPCIAAIRFQDLNFFLFRLPAPHHPKFKIERLSPMTVFCDLKIPSKLSLQCGKRNFRQLYCNNDNSYFIDQ